MKKRRPAQPWKVTFYTEDGSLPEQEFSSEAKAYLSVNLKRELIREGKSAVVRATVYEWDMRQARWMMFERHDLVKEMESVPPNKELQAMLVDIPETPEEIVESKNTEGSS